MRAGRLARTIIEIQEKTDAGTVDDYGNPVESWSTFATRRAAQVFLSGKEYDKFDARQSEASVQFELRSVSGVTEEMRVLCSGIYYGIVEPPRLLGHTHRDMILTCKEKSYEPGAS